MPTVPRLLRPVVGLSALAALLALGGCASREPARSEPLFDAAHTPDVLTEERYLAMPPATGGNRFLSGWWPRQQDREQWLVPQPDGARLELVNLSERSRLLVLETEPVDGPADAPVRIAVAGRPLAAMPRRDRLEIPLPSRLPLGRLPVDLVTEPATIAVRQAALTPSLPPGWAHFADGDLQLEGDAMVDLVRQVEPDTTLVGVFIPPSGPRRGQRFELCVEDGSGGPPRQSFVWNASRWSFLAQPNRFRFPLGRGGLLRFRFRARGEGPSARWRSLRLERASSAPPPPAPPASAAVIPAAPQVVIVYVLDALRADYVAHLGGPPGATPVIDRLAAEGADFDHHFSVAPNTVPSTKSLFTGRVFLTRGGWKLPADGPTTLAERFARSGYHTGLFTGNGNVTSAQGLARGFETAPVRTLFGHSIDETKLPYNDNAARVHAAALEWLDRLDARDKVFMHIQTVHPHNPYAPPPELRQRFTAGIPSNLDGSTATLMSLVYHRREADDADRARLRGLYTGGLAYNDREIDRFLAEIQRRYPPGQVLLVVTSDHGEELFDHGGLLHGYTLYEEQLKIPLIIWWPGQVAPQKVESTTDNIDLHASLAVLAEGAQANDSNGRPLWGMLAGETMPPRPIRFAAASSVDGGIFMASSERYRVIWAPRTAGLWGMGQGLGRGRDVEYVFDLATDPGEKVNLAGTDNLEAAWLRGALFSWVEVGRRLEEGTPMEELDPETRRSLEALGYVQ